jgi:hypothetical protein
MPPPLTHHEILAVVAPFARRGRRVDLQATDRIARRIVFRPLQHPGDASGRPALRETLELADTGDDRWRLTRRLALGGGPQASLHAEGTDPGALLARIESVTAARQVLWGDGFTIALDQRLDPPGAADGGGTAPDARGAQRVPVRDADLVLVRGEAHAGGLVLAMKVPTVSGISAGLILGFAPGGTRPTLPEDLLAVLGRSWSCLDRTSTGWTATVGLRGRGAARIADAQAKLEQAAAHLARTLAEPPARFHERLRAARWRVVARRSLPLGVGAALIAGAAAVPTLGLASDSPIRMLIFNAPPLLLALFFCLREIPRIELPPLPRRSRATAWHPPAPGVHPTPDCAPASTGR